MHDPPEVAVTQMFLPDLERKDPAGHYAPTIAALRAAGQPVPQIMFLFAYRPEMTEHLARFTQEVMRGPSPLSPGQRELIAAYTSKLNHCMF
jgi:alkylhydroperoxidase family enzyme